MMKEASVEIISTNALPRNKKVNQKKVKFGFGRVSADSNTTPYVLLVTKISQEKVGDIHRNKLGRLNLNWHR